MRGKVVRTFRTYDAIRAPVLAPKNESGGSCASRTVVRKINVPLLRTLPSRAWIGPCCLQRAQVAVLLHPSADKIIVFVGYILEQRQQHFPGSTLSYDRKIATELAVVAANRQQQQQKQY